MNGNIKKGYLFAIMSAIIYGCMPLMAKRIYADGLNPLSLVFYRNVFSLLPLGILAYAQNKTLKLPARQLPSISLIATLGCCVTPILLFTSYQFIESGTATVFHFVYPALVILLEFLFTKKQMPAGNVLSVLLCITGICLFYSPTQAPNLTGSILALSSGLTCAAYVILLSHFDTHAVPGFLFSFYVTAVSSVITFVFCVATGSLVIPATLHIWGLCILFSLLVTTGAVVLFQQSAFHIGSARASILSTLEPITSIVIGAVFFSEPLGVRTLLGSALVILASLLIALFDIKNAKSSKT